MKPLPTLFCRISAGACAVLVACFPGPARADASATGVCTDPTHRHAAAAFRAPVRALDGGGPTADRSAPPPLVARYRVTLLEARADGSGSDPLREQRWTYLRSADRVAIDKGAIEEIWQRLPNGAVALQRVLHTPRRVVDYSPGELASLGIEADWHALSTLAAAGDHGLPPSSATVADGVAVDRDVAWDAALQLPTRIERAVSASRLVRYELIEWATTDRVDWLLPGARARSYLHIDAADLGDLPDDPAARQAEALDARAGWRRVHAH